MSLATESPPVLSLALAGTRMTPEEFDAVEEWDEDYKYELIHGILVVTPVPLPQETGPNELLGHWLLNYREQHPQGGTLDYSLMEQYVRTLDSRRRADRLIWAGLGRLPKVKADVPTIVVEFVSAGKRNRQRDYVEKRGEYLALGVREYWIVDRFRRTLTVCRSGQEDQIVPESGTYRTPLLPGFDLVLAPLLAAADLWDGQE
ncbi:Uma2 family endonuclease [Tautonia sp. JC769]|uniref:Uma2 family endonuclease n=1 Tax=Tautonia sp. JC769 TaxID=3232135 RepID=UPI00345AB390